MFRGNWQYVAVGLVVCLPFGIGLAQQTNQFDFAALLSSGTGIVASSSSSSDASASGAEAAISAVPQPIAKKDGDESVRPFSRIAVGSKISSLGWGGQIATPITRQLNLRGGAEFFNFGYGLTSDGTNYYASLHMKSGTVQADYYPFRRSSFHVSPGVLIFKSAAGASMFVPGGNTFTENDTDYTSDPNDPVHGAGTITFSRTAMPMVTLGFGNMIKRNENRHWSVPFEIGAAYTGHYAITTSLAGSVCNQDGGGNVSDPSVQQNVLQQQNKINEQMKRFQVLPVLTTGVTYRF